MTPLVLTRGSRGGFPSWPWHKPVGWEGFGAAPFYEKKVTGPPQEVPVEIAQILSVKEWVFDFAFWGSNYDLSYSFTVLSGTFLEWQNLDPGEDEETVLNTPGWRTLDEAVEMRKWAATDPADFHPIAGVSFNANFPGDEVETGPISFRWIAHLLYPRIGGDNAYDGAGWEITIRAEVGERFAGHTVNDITGLTFNGELIGDEPDEACVCSLVISPGGNYAS